MLVLACPLAMAEGPGELPAQAAAPARQIIGPGDRAPVDTLLDLSDAATTFPVQGSWNLVFYWSLFCQSCLEEIPDLVEGLANLQNISCRQFYVSIDTVRMRKGILNYLRRRNFECTVLLEEIASAAFRTADRWGVSMTPATFLIDPAGTVVFSREGPFDLEELYRILRSECLTTAADGKETTGTAVPDAPDVPGAPDTPDAPAATPDAVNTPDAFDAPYTPTRPATLDASGTPDAPDVADAPDAPATPANTPGTPDMADAPDAPAMPDMADAPDATATPADTPGTPDMADAPDAPATPANTPDMALPPGSVAISTTMRSDSSCVASPAAETP